MKFEDTGLEGLVIEFQSLEEIMENAGFYYGWDYERVTFDHKIVVRDEIYYFRLLAYAVEGEIPKLDSKVKLMYPLLGKHYYPHGVEYHDEVFAKNIVDKCNKKINL